MNGNDSFGTRDKKGISKPGDLSLSELEETRIELVKFTQELDRRLSIGKIRKDDYSKAIADHLYGKSKEEVLSFIDKKIEMIEKGDRSRKQAITASLTMTIIIILGLVGILYYNPGSLTGLASLSPMQESLGINQTYSLYSEIPLNLTNISGFKITGTLEGQGAIIKLITENGEYIVASLNNTVLQNKTTQYVLSTDKKQYLLGEHVIINVSPASESSSTYVVFGDQNNIISNMSYLPELPGDYQLVTLISTQNDIIRLELNFSVADVSNNSTDNNDSNNISNNANIASSEENKAIQEVAETFNGTRGTLTFDNACDQSCTIPKADNITLIIAPEQGTNITISSITIVVQKQNLPPVQIKSIPNLLLEPGQTAVINLSEYFKEPQGEAVSFDISQLSGISTVVLGDQLSLISIAPGIYTAHIYATDGNEMITSNDFSITVNREGANSNIIDETATNQTGNDSQNSTEGKTESNLSISTNLTNTTEAPAIDACNDPDLKDKPSYCYLGNEDKAFQEIIAPLENHDGVVLGRFTRFGNLIIKGVIVQNSTGEPGTEDFRIGYAESKDFQETIIYTSWIEKETGDLHLKGQIYEEQDPLQIPQSDSYPINNRFGISLAYFNKRTGDLYLKGNLVQLGNI